MLSNRANALCVLKILQEYSDENHILPMREIIGHLQKSYDVKMDRRTVYSTIELLQYLEYDVSDYEDNGQGYYLRSRILEPSELRILTDAVYSFPFISAEQSKKLINKLQGVESAHHRKKYRHLSVIRQGRKTENKQVFLNIELLDEAIEQKKKVSFTYLSYDEKLKLVPRRAKPYIVDPLGMTYTNEHYYLVCTLTGCENTSLYRIDRMRGLSVLDEPAEQANADAATVAENAVYAFVGAPEEITFAFDKGILNDVVDRFGTSIRLSDDGERYVAKVTASPRGVKFWALQYLPYVEVTEPRWLREEIVESVRKSPYGQKTEGTENGYERVDSSQGART